MRTLTIIVASFIFGFRGQLTVDFLLYVICTLYVYPLITSNSQIHIEIILPVGSEVTLVVNKREMIRIAEDTC